MILVDTSVWIDYLRAAETPATREVRRWVAQSMDEIAVCEPVAMEVLAGAPDDAALEKLERLVNGLPSLTVENETDFRAAAGVFRAARRAGRTVRSLTDCLIAVVALRHGATLVHKDVDYEVIAGITGLDAVSLR